MRLIYSAVLSAVLLVCAACGGGSGGGDNGILPETAITVTGAGTSLAGTRDMTYTFQPGTYTYAISGFAAGDRLIFPVDQAPTVDNNNWNDGIVRVQWASGGNVMTAELTGYTPDQDAALNSVANFNTVFGAGTVQ